MINHPSNKITAENLKDVVYWHRPTATQIEDMERIAKQSELMMGLILAVCPDCADRNEALRFVRAARMWANASLVLVPSDVPTIDHTRQGMETEETPCQCTECGNKVISVAPINSVWPRECWKCSMMTLEPEGRK